MAILDHLQSEVALPGLTEESLVLQRPDFPWSSYPVVFFPELTYLE